VFIYRVEVCTVLVEPVKASYRNGPDTSPVISKSVLYDSAVSVHDIVIILTLQRRRYGGPAHFRRFLNSAFLRFFRDFLHISYHISISIRDLFE
jgi:hypothetical protein